MSDDLPPTNTTPPDAPPDQPGEQPGERPDNDEPLFEILPSETPPARELPQRLPRSRPGWTVLSIENADDGKFSYSVSGIRPVKGQALRGWNVDFGMLNVQMNDLGRYLAAYYHEDDMEGREAWMYTAQQIGTHLYHGLLNSTDALTPYLAGARRWAFSVQKLMLSFGGPREYLTVPYELLNDGQMPLALKHPISRQIGGMVSRHPQTFTQFIEHLRATAQPLRILLIASAAEDAPEIAALHDLITQNAARSGLTVEVDRVQAGASGLNDALRKLEGCRYHIVHYAGMVYLDRMNPDQDGLLFSTGQDELLGQTLLSSERLAHLLRRSETRLFYVSACVGPQVWDQYVLKDRDYLDLFAALVRAGIPYVLGFRWYIARESRQRFATLFYDSLLRHAPYIPEEAALYARRETQRYDRQDEAWASPILIAQNTYADAR